ncbi:MAG: peptide-methionine (S)-S-oxide reductase MsrA [bacterium]|nr:peptide-methionine (S)-S-oxide reductase MsrA [bacterium]
MNSSEKQLATFASGCFWCTEAVFKRVKGVEEVVSGYTGGDSKNPNYSRIHTLHSGHVEAIQLEYDPEIVSYETLVEIFFGTHDPTTLNRQGYDIGPEYRSIIFYHSEEQRHIVEQVKFRLEKEQVFNGPIVTVVEPVKAFYPAENEHQDFYAKYPELPYCQVVIDPKIAKLRKKYAEYLTKE